MRLTKCTQYALATAMALGLSVGAAAAAGDAEKGKKDFRKCKACHALKEGKNKVGPSLHNIVGRKAGTVEGYKYSPSYLEAGEKGLVWTPEQLIAYLENPKGFLKTYLGQDKVKSKMVQKFKKQALRENVVAYLESLTE
ncbi:MAG: c-type cytochrome [Hyphomicrobiales bacterium]